MKIIFATGNKGKIKEIREIFADSDYDVVSMKDAGVDIEIDENGSTFEENSLIKAQAVYSALRQMQSRGDFPSDEKFIVMADDSGLEIDYLGGEPGVYSARFMEGKPYTEKCAELIRRLENAGPDERGARFRDVITAILDDGTILAAKGSMEGTLAFAPKGANGFGYDPILYIPELKKTAAELSDEEKNAISHRGKALEEMKKLLKKTDQKKLM